MGSSGHGHGSGRLSGAEYQAATPLAIGVRRVSQPRSSLPARGAEGCRDSVGLDGLDPDRRLHVVAVGGQVTFIALPGDSASHDTTIAAFISGLGANRSFKLISRHYERGPMVLVFALRPGHPIQTRVAPACNFSPSAPITLRMVSLGHARRKAPCKGFRGIARRLVRLAPCPWQATIRRVHCAAQFLEDLLCLNLLFPA